MPEKQSPLIGEPTTFWVSVMMKNIKCYDLISHRIDAITRIYITQGIIAEGRLLIPDHTLA